MKKTLQRYAAQATKAKPSPAAQTAPTAAPAARSWSAPDPGVFAAQKPVEAPVAKRDTLDTKMVAELAKITQQLNQLAGPDKAVAGACQQIRSYSP